jgi:lipoyl(octanoyl) transferase
MTARPEPPFSSRGAARRPLAVWLAGRIGWDAYATLAERLAWEVSEPGGRPPTLLVTELEPAVTIGRLGSRADVDFSAEDLRSRGLAVRFVGRGGGAVLHGPGQVFVALFAALEDLGLGRHDVGCYVARFEAGLAAAVERMGASPGRRPGRHGLFGRTGLLAAVGIAVRRGVACHGGFVNVCPALEPFRQVHVGATGAEALGTMGSLEAEVRRKVRMQDARTAVTEGLANAFAFPQTQIQSGFPLAIPPAARPERFSRVG